MRRLKVLIVDDVPTFRKLLKKQLERRGIVRIDEAGDGVDALEMMQHTQYSAVLMDVMMPRMNGDVCARKMREWEATHGGSSVPILLMSADVLSEDNDVVESGTVQYFFTKPIDIVRLGNSLRDIAAASSKLGSWTQTASNSTGVHTPVDMEEVIDVVIH
ncbi:CheY-like superfamily protein [Tribonema minus]|nr:CheY-like superfamily protein [Tribonema minus]